MTHPIAQRPVLVFTCRPSRPVTRKATPAAPTVGTVDAPLAHPYRCARPGCKVVVFLTDEQPLPEGWATATLPVAPGRPAGITYFCGAHAPRPVAVRRPRRRPA